MKARYQNGLTEWHLEHVQMLLMALLSHKHPEAGAKGGNSRQLIQILAEQFDLHRKKIAEVFDIVAVTRTSSGRSLHRTLRGKPVELLINWGRLEAYRAGGEVEEYALLANDPVIGNRWVQNIDEAIIMSLGHELAHHIVALKWNGVDTKPHGDEFKDAYRIIRRFGVNPLLDEFAATEAQQTEAKLSARLLRKVQALRKMAEDETSNENEAERAVSQLQGLLSKHGIQSEAELHNANPHFVERIVPVLKWDGYKPLLHLCFAIAKFSGTRAVVHTSGWRAAVKYDAYGSYAPTDQYISYFGAPVDVEMAVYASEVIFHALYAETDRFKASGAYKEARATGKHPRTILFSFRRAFVGRINRRLAESRETVENDWCESQVTSKEIMVARDAKLEAAFTTRHPRLGTCRSSASSSEGIESASSAGRSAADRVNLNRPAGRDSPNRLERF